MEIITLQMPYTLNWRLSQMQTSLQKFGFRLPYFIEKKLEDINRRNSVHIDAPNL